MDESKHVVQTCVKDDVENDNFDGCKKQLCYIYFNCVYIFLHTRFLWRCPQVVRRTKIGDLERVTEIILIIFRKINLWYVTLDCTDGEGLDCTTF